MDDIIYEEHQTAAWYFRIVAAVGIGALLLLKQGGDRLNTYEQGLIIGIAIFVALIFFSMCRLTITLTAKEIRWRYNWIRFPGWRIPLSDIRSVETTKSSWYEGWGIRYTTTGMLYNVTGTEAIRLHLKNASSLRLGTQQAAQWRGLLEGRTGPDARISGNRYG